MERKSGPCIRAEDARVRGVVEYKPKKIAGEMHQPAIDFISAQVAGTGSHFRINPLLADQTGISELERMSTEERVERRALERLKEIQEGAYQEAFELGREEGRRLAYEETKGQIENQIGEVGKVVQRVESLFEDLVEQNEAKIVDMLFYLAKQIAFDEIRDNRDRVVPILKSLAESLRSDEQITLHLSKTDVEHVESLRAVLGKELDFLKRTKIMEDQAISPGGCIVETNFGVVDASLETRVEKLWKILSEKKPKVKDQVG